MGDLNDLIVACWRWRFWRFGGLQIAAILGPTQATLHKHTKMGQNLKLEKIFHLPSAKIRNQLLMFINWPTKIYNSLLID